MKYNGKSYTDKRWFQKENKGFTLIELLIVMAGIVTTIGIVIIIGLLISICIQFFNTNVSQNQEQLVANILLKNGYRDITITGFEVDKCAQNDDYAIGFDAKNSNNIVLHGTVCLNDNEKYSTIRFRD